MKSSSPEVQDPSPEGDGPRGPLPLGDPVFEGARRVVGRLRQAGHEAWLVGGGVRDVLMGRTPKDWDVATSALPAEVRRLFPRNIPVGVQFGVVRVILGGHAYEVATFREDLGYSDGRRPDSVRFGRLTEDVLRRDFTINGLALDPFSGRVVDLVGGMRDLRDGRIRAIGDPDQRFAEDHLRPLRAVRFAARTGFRIEDATWEALVRWAPHIATVSPERIAEEMGRLLDSERPGLGWILLDRSGMLPVVLPEWEGPVDRTAQALDRLQGRPLAWLWAGALRPSGPERARRILGRLRRSTALQNEVGAILETIEDLEAMPSGDVAQEKRLIRRSEVPAALAVAEAWGLTPRSSGDPFQWARERLSQWRPEDLFPERLLSGHDVLRSGVRPGPEVAAMLRAVEDAQLRGEVRNRSEALGLVRRLMEQDPHPSRPGPAPGGIPPRTTRGHPEPADMDPEP